MSHKCLKCGDAKGMEVGGKMVLKCNLKGTFSIHEISVFVAIKSN